MSAPELEDALVEFLAMNTHELRYLSNNETDEKVPPHVYCAFVPRNQVGEVIPGMITVYPAIIVRAKLGIQEIDFETIQMEILVGIYDGGLNEQGNRDCLNLITRIMNRIREQSIIRNRYRLGFPMNWQLNVRASSGQDNYSTFPYYFAEIHIPFKDTVPGSQYETTTMSPDSSIGRFNVPSFAPEVEPYRRDIDE